MKKHELIACINFLMNESSLGDLENFEEWIKNPKNSRIFESYLKTNYLIDVSMNSFNLDKAKQEFLDRVEKDKRIHIKRKQRHVFAYLAAALFVGFLGISYLLQSDSTRRSSFEKPVVINNTIVPGTDKALLTLEDGSEVMLEKGKPFKTKNAVSSGDKIVYEGISDLKKEIAYNTITIPRGGQFFIVLSDETKVWLNSETQLKYPVNFVDGAPRQVELIYGEAYFEVSHSTLHKDSHFTILNNHQEVEVLGTKFNIKAYKDDTDIFTTLVKGSVAVKALGSVLLLKPNEQVQLNKTEETITKQKVNSRNVISWTEGNFDFKDRQLGDIMKVLSRWYDMDVEFENENLKKERFNGRIGKQYKIEEILSNILSADIINSYEIHDNKILIK